MASISKNFGSKLILGFSGPVLPDWIRDFESRHGLGGVILFDYSVKNKNYHNNIESPEQLKTLCQEISAFPSRPMIVTDQEGGKVRRLKESKGFAALPAACDFVAIGEGERKNILLQSFLEMRALGITMDLGPVVDVNFNSQSPDIGMLGRSFSDDIKIVERMALEWANVAKQCDLLLCLKHFPGLGGAISNSHEELTDISSSINSDQIELFYRLVPQIPGNAILVSHGIVQQWDRDLPVSMSKKVISEIKDRVPGAILISDDVQMQGLQKIMSTKDAIRRGLEAGLDFVIVGNNLMNEEGVRFFV